MLQANQPGCGVRRWTAALSIVLLFGGTLPAARAQNAAPTPQAAAAPKLTISILDGEGAINNIRQRTAREPIVQVEDENHRPVAGAVVIFMLPDRGASGVFPNGSSTLTATTDAQGKAVATGLKPNSVTGNYQVQVTASYQGQSVSIAISQSNVLTAAAAGAAGGIGVKTILIILGIAGGAAAGGIIAATHGGGNSSSTSVATPPATATGVSIGAPSVSAPR